MEENAVLHWEDWVCSISSSSDRFLLSSGQTKSTLSLHLHPRFTASNTPSLLSSLLCPPACSLGCLTSWHTHLCPVCRPPSHFPNWTQTRAQNLFDFTEYSYLVLNPFLPPQEHQHKPSTFFPFHHLILRFSVMVSSNRLPSHYRCPLTSPDWRINSPNWKINRAHLFIKRWWIPGLGWLALNIPDVFPLRWADKWEERFSIWHVRPSQRHTNCEMLQGGGKEHDDILHADKHTTVCTGGGECHTHEHVHISALFIRPLDVKSHEDTWVTSILWRRQWDVVTDFKVDLWVSHYVSKARNNWF